MPRPIRCRRIRSKPAVTYFKPAGIRMVELKEVILTLEEHEVVRLIDLENPDEYQPFSNVPELQRHMKDLKIKSANFLSGDTIEQNDTDTIYVLTPLDYLDFFALMDGKNVDSYFGMGIPNLPRHLRLFHDQGIKITSVSPLEGRLGNWDVSSRGSIIAVETPGDFCGGIPLDAAIELHERPPLHKLGANLGGFIRPNGYTPAKDPRFVALPDEDGFKQIARDGMSIPEIRTIAQQASLPLFVGAYHIDSSKAFEAWAQVAKKFI